MSATPRVAVAGFMHETNTFSPYPTELVDFQVAGAWPGMKRGARILSELAGMNISTPGAVEVLRDVAEIVPLTWCSAQPSGIVTTPTFETVAEQILTDLQRSGHVDAVLLELHGAMVTDDLDDAELELVSRVRRVVGASVPIGVTLDLHANVSAELVHAVDCMDAYRTYPHVDIAATGARAAQALLELLRTGQPFEKAVRRPDFLIPTPWQCTEIEPARSIYRQLSASVRDEVPVLAFTPGFNASDVPCCGPAVFGYGRSRAAVEAAVAALDERVRAAEFEFAGPILGARDAVQTALAVWDGRRPVIIADAQDNPGGGGAGDTTAILAELVRQGATDAVVAILCDADAVAAAHAAGIGSRLHRSLGGRTDGNALEGTFAVEQLGSGTMKATGPMYDGVTMELGPLALLRIDGVRVIVATKPIQPADQSVFHHLGVEPAQQRILVLKSVVHFRNAFAALSGEIVIAAAAGLQPVDTRTLPFRRLAPGMRRAPGMRADHSAA